MSSDGLALPTAGAPDVPVALASGGAAWEVGLLPLVERHRSGLHLARRCVDLADLLAVSRAGLVDVAVVAADLARLDRDQVARLRADGVSVLLVETRRTSGVSLGLGASDVAVDDMAPEDLLRMIHSLAQRSATEVPATPTHPVPEPSARGRLVAVWGPTGAPGRSTVAVNLAAEAAASGVSTLLVDADTAGGALSTRLGVLDEAPGLAAACRSASRDRLGTSVLAEHALAVDENLRVLTGATRPDRWRELRPAALEVVWQTARRLVDLVVVDLGAGLSAGADALTGAAHPEGVSDMVVGTADVVVVVGSPDPLGMLRLVHALDLLGEAAPHTRVIVAVNRVRDAVVGRNPQQAVREALERFAGPVEVCLLPDDPRAADSSTRATAPLRAVAPTSALRTGVLGLLGQVLPGCEPGSTRTARRSRRTRRRPSVPSTR